MAMRTVDLANWSDFHKAVNDIRGEFGSRDVNFGDGRTTTFTNCVLFRGQSDSRWGLKTTLERTTAEEYSVLRYWQRADSVVNEIESLTRQKWQLKSRPETRNDVSAAYDSLHVDLPDYEYLVYLRHHGFPSPLLDWTRSPYIAAYFALEQSNQADRCAVFAFIETPTGGKSRREGDVMITSMGPYITTHARHFSQKCHYTIATRCNGAAKEHVFAPHEAVAPSPVGVQDILIKITIPRRDRGSALQELDDYNINHYTLFQTEDSLVKSLGLRAFELEQ